MEMKDVFKDILDKTRNDMILKLDRKDIEEDIKEEYATIKDFRNKKGEINKNDVKFSEVKSAMEVYFNLKDKDLLEEKYVRREEYLNDLKQGAERFPVDKLKSYMLKSDVIANNKDELKELEKKSINEEVVTTDEFKALSEIAKSIVKKEEILEKIKRAEERGESINIQDKENQKAELEELKNRLIRELNLNF